MAKDIEVAYINDSIGGGVWAVICECSETLFTSSSEDEARDWADDWYATKEGN